MKSIVVFLILLVASIGFADVRIDPYECHSIRSVENTDDEIKHQNCQGVIAEDGNGGANAYFRLTKSVTKAEAAAILRNRSYNFTSTDGGGACNIEDAEGNTYTSKNWESNINYRKHRKWRWVEYEIICLDGQQNN